MPNIRQAHLGTFTNRPERRGEEGVTYTPDLPWWKDYEKEEPTSITGGPERITAETPEGGGYAGKPEELGAAREMVREGAQPPGDFVAPDFSPEGEKRFEQQIFKQLEKTFQIPGGNPFLYNPQEEAQKADAMLPDIFNKFFKGQVTWADRGTLDTEQKKAWNSVVQKFHAFSLNKASQNQKSAEDAYKQMMGQFTAERKKRETAQEKTAKMDWEREKFKTREKRLGAPKEKTADLKRLFDMNQKLEKELNETGKISPNSLRIYNELAKRIGQEQIVKTKEAKKGWKIPFIDVTIGREKAGYGAPEAGAEKRAAAPQKRVVKTGTHKGRKVVQYDDGSVGYAD